jgi:MarR family transcriptional regulator, transcriptional regulator for hemolysin
MQQTRDCYTTLLIIRLLIISFVTMKVQGAMPPDGPMSATDDDARRDVMFVLHDVARLIRVEADKRARAHGMTRAQWVILVRIESQPGLSQKALAELLEVEPITVARLIDRMERRGIIERRPDPKDRRVWRLHLCASAEPLLAELNEARTGLARMVTSGLDRAAVDQLSDALLTMKGSLIQDVRPARRPTAEALSAAPIAASPRELT